MTTVTATTLTSAIGDGTSLSTSSISPSGNKLILASVYTVFAGGGTLPTLSGNGLTWVQVNTNKPAGSIMRLTLFRAMGASPSSGAVTVDCGGDSQLGIAIALTEFGVVDTSGTNGSAAVVQTNTDNASSDTTLTVTLSSAFSNINNATFGTFSYLSGATTTTFTPGSGFTELFDNNNIQQEWKTSNDTTVDVTTADSGTIIGIAVEIKAIIGPRKRPLGIDAGIARRLSR